jgi:SprT protein
MKATAGVRDRQLEVTVDRLLLAAAHPELCGKFLVFWSRRLRTTAGLACYQRGAILLNPALREVGEEEVDRTLRHELAHLLAASRYPKRRLSPHGAEWQKACADLGIPGEARCHTLPWTRQRQRRKFFYQCPVCSQIVARVKPLTPRSACLGCCRTFNGGRYHERFRFRLVTDQPPEGLFSLGPNHPERGAD